MAAINYDRIVNGTPTKRISHAYESMKENYTKESAQTFRDSYIREPLSSIMDNARLVFSEAYNGVNDFTNIFTDHSNCAFSYYEDALSQIDSFISENGSKMSEKQKALYDNMLTNIRESANDAKFSIMYSSYIKENLDEDFEKNLSDLIFEYKNNLDESKDYESEFVEMFTDVNPIISMTYLPYVIESVNNQNDTFSTLSSITSSFITESEDYQDMKDYFDRVVCGNKLKSDKSYLEAVSELPKSNRVVIESFMNSSLKEISDSISKSEIVKPEDVTHILAESAVNSIFDDISDDILLEKYENHEEKNKINMLKSLAYESTMDILLYEYQTCEDTNHITFGYSLLGDNYSVENAVKIMHENFDDSFITEADEEEDVSDDDINSLNNEDNTNEVPTGKK